MRTAQQISKQASQNSNASRIKWQRQAIANGAQVIELKARIAELQAINENMGQMVANHCHELTTYRQKIDRLNAACLQAENEADLWRSMAHELQDMDVRRKARDMMKGGAI